MFLNDIFNTILKYGAYQNMTEKQFLEHEITHWLTSEARDWQMTGHDYYLYNQAIDRKERQVIGEGGQLQTVHNLPNNRLKDNRYAFLVDQKTNYLLAKPVDAKADEETAQDVINDELGPAFRRTLREVGKDALNCGISYLFPYIEENALKFKRFYGYEILPFWKDRDHTELDAFLRMYPQEVYEGQTRKIVWRVEWYTLDGVRKFIWESGGLKAESDDIFPYLVINDGSGDPVEGEDGGPVTMNWQRIPLIPFKANEDELPLIRRVKSLQDALNTLYSNYADSTQEDARNTILVIRNYDGQDLGSFRRNLAQFGAVKVRDQGGIDTLQINVNSENYISIINLLRRAIIENGRGVDSKDERLTSGTPNMMNIRSMYTDLDLDADEMEMEFQASLQQLMWFVNAFNTATGKPAVDVQFIFNRDTMVNEGDTINNCRASVGIISEETIIANHPWVKDSKAELERVKAEQAEKMQDMMDAYGGMGGATNNGNDAGPNREKP